MYEQADVMHVRRDIEKIIGSTVQLESNKGRQKSVVSRGIVSQVYPSIFTIQTSETPSRKVSFSYTDVLTNSVEITLCE